MTTVFLSIGSNLGDRLGFLKAAADSIKALPDTKILVKSPIYETGPVGGVEQGPFLNGVIAIDTELAPKDLLLYLQHIEACNGRERKVHWGPRTLDIDILCYGDLVSVDRELMLPHPELAGRAFVLVPWAEIAGDWQVVGKGKVKELLEQLPVLEIAGVERCNYFW